MACGGVTGPQQRRMLAEEGAEQTISLSYTAEASTDRQRGSRRPHRARQALRLQCEHGRFRYWRPPRPRPTRRQIRRAVRDVRQRHGDGQYEEEEEEERDDPVRIEDTPDADADAEHDPVPEAEPARLRHLPQDHPAYVKSQYASREDKRDVRLRRRAERRATAEAEQRANEKAEAEQRANEKEESKRRAQRRIKARYPKFSRWVIAQTAGTIYWQEYERVLFFETLTSVERKHVTHILQQRFRYLEIRPALINILQIQKHDKSLTMQQFRANYQHQNAKQSHLRNTQFRCIHIDWGRPSTKLAIGVLFLLLLVLYVISRS